MLFYLSVYTEPLTPEIVAKIIKEEKVDAILPTMGGQTGLNIATGLGDLGLLDGIKVFQLCVSHGCQFRRLHRISFQYSTLHSHRSLQRAK